MEVFLLSAGVVALGEMGDKTQLLAIVMAAAFRRPWPIVLGIAVATLANHALAGAVGALVAEALGPDRLRWVIGGSFLAMACWMLVPDQADDEALAKRRTTGALGIFAAVTLAFFVAEMGDKTQIATVVLAARYEAVAAVVAGTTLGMLVANVPAVLLGERIARAFPMRLVHVVTAAVFALLGLLTLAGVGQSV